MVAVDFAVEHAERVLVKPRLTVLAQFMRDRLKVADERFAVRVPTLGIPERVDDDFDFLQAERLVNRVGEADDLGIDGRVTAADCLDTVLVQLTEATFLRTLVAEHRSHVVQFRRLVGATEQLVRDEGANDRSRPFRTERVLVLTFFHEREHLFLDDVRRLTDASFK